MAPCLGWAASGIVCRLLTSDFRAWSSVADAQKSRKFIFQNLKRRCHIYGTPQLSAPLRSPLSSFNRLQSTVTVNLLTPTSSSFGPISSVRTFESKHAMLIRREIESEAEAVERRREMLVAEEGREALEDFFELCGRDRVGMILQWWYFREGEGFRAREHGGRWRSPVAGSQRKLRLALGRCRASLMTTRCYAQICVRKLMTCGDLAAQGLQRSNKNASGARLFVPRRGSTQSP